jgi:hypothetical protein
MTLATKTYDEVCTEIKVLEERIREVEKERKFLRRRMFDNSPYGANLTASYDIERVTGGQVPMPLDVVIERLNKIDIQLDQLYTLLEAKKKTRDVIDNIIKSSEDLDQKVVFMRDHKNMPLWKIANELDYSYDHIRRISSRNKKTCHIDATKMRIKS